MKIVCIGDLHGKDVWKEALNIKADRYIFVGDYFDSFTITHKQQIENFKEIIYAAKNNPKIQLLIGNHDAHYFLWMTDLFHTCRGTGYSSNMVYKVYNLYKENEELFKIAWEHNDWLVTHAGLTNNFFTNDLEDFKKNYYKISISDFLNSLWKIKSNKLIKISKERGGYDDFGGPLWCGKDELKKSPYAGYNQIVGHTSGLDIDKFCYIDWLGIETNQLIYFIDCLDNKTEFLTLEI